MDSRGGSNSVTTYTPDNARGAIHNSLDSIMNSLLKIHLKLIKKQQLTVLLYTQCV